MNFTSVCLFFPRENSTIVTLNISFTGLDSSQMLLLQDSLENDNYLGKMKIIYSLQTQYETSLGKPSSRTFGHSFRISKLLPHSQLTILFLLIVASLPYLFPHSIIEIAFIQWANDETNHSHWTNQSIVGARITTSKRKTSIAHSSH